jgi:preprotein translocase subunit YajC
MSIDFVSGQTAGIRLLARSWGLLFVPYLVVVFVWLMQQPQQIARLLGWPTDEKGVIVEYFLLDMIVFIAVPGVLLSYFIIRQGKQKRSERKEGFISHFAGRDLRTTQLNPRSVYLVEGEDEASGKKIVRLVWEDEYVVLEGKRELASNDLLVPFDENRFRHMDG